VSVCCVSFDDRGSDIDYSVTEVLLSVRKFPAIDVTDSSMSEREVFHCIAILMTF